MGGDPTAVPRGVPRVTAHETRLAMGSTGRAMEKGEALAVDAPMRIARAIQAKLAKVGSRPHWYARESLPEIMTILDHEIRRALARMDAD